MVSLSTGGGSSAVAASTHAGCARYRRTDPMVMGMSRRKLAAELGHPDTEAGIPEARWVRAMTFERLVRADHFVSQLLTTAVGALGLARPAQVRRADAGVSIDTTAKLLAQAHLKAVHEGTATMLTGLAVPFVGLEREPNATPVKPDFAIVAPRAKGSKTVGSWLVMGDAKDYERVRSRIDDHRMLKGFLQVALGAESVAAWSKLPNGMEVHPSGALAVPRNSFLQPEAVVEHLADHRREVLARVSERTQLVQEFGGVPLAPDQAKALVPHLEATYDPATCTSCALFNFCRTEVRARTEPEAVLIEIGVQRELRAPLAQMIAGGQPPERVPESVVMNVRATLTGKVEWTGQRRTDPVGLPGTISVVLAKADSAALGVHGIGVRRVQPDGHSTPWQFTVFDDSQAPTTRLEVMGIVGTEVAAAIKAFGVQHRPVHLVVPDATTADVLVSIADSLAGVETSRLRWQRDLDQGRPALTFNGEPARVPEPLTDQQRTGVSFLLEEDRARAMVLRCPIVDLRAVLAHHIVPGGPVADAGRLDYLVTWAAAQRPLAHRDVSDSIAAGEHTPGARLTNAMSDRIHRAGRGGKRGHAPDLPEYRRLVRKELEYKASVVDAATAVLQDEKVSALREAHLALEADAQEVWRRRLRLHASDLVRFGRTYAFWRNNQVTMRDDDLVCDAKLRAVSNPAAALDMARDAGTREVALAEVVSVKPLRVKVASRRMVGGSSVALLHRNGQPVVEQPPAEVVVQAGSIRLNRMPFGPLAADAHTATDGALRWAPTLAPTLAVGDRLIVADMKWFEGGLKSGHQFNIKRPKPDTTSSPGKDCHDGSYAADPENHQWCCRPHEAAEAEYADELAERRERGELNPTVWPPIVDEDGFDTPADGSPVAADITDTGDPSPDLTIDDVD